MLQRRSGLLAALSLGAALMSLISGARAASAEEDPCVRPAPGSAVTEPKDLRSEHGVLKLDLQVRNYREADGSVRYCYRLPDGTESPTLRLHPGDWLILHLKNELEKLGPSAQPHGHAHAHEARSHAALAAQGTKSSDPCSSGMMSAMATNLHFHGLTVPPVCHQDDVLKTSIQPGDPPFEYRFQIPAGEPPGLYWYHPHIHGFSKAQVLGGASGALIVEGIERSNRELAGLPERVFIIRDQDLLNPAAPPAKSEPVVSKMTLDHDGDAANTGMGYGRPAKDLSINFVPVPYPDYQPAVIQMKP